MNIITLSLLSLIRRIRKKKERFEQRRVELLSRERDELLAKGDRSAYLEALGHQFPEASEPAKRYLESLDALRSRENHRFIVTHQTARLESYHHFLGALLYPLILHEKNFGFEPGSVFHVQDCGSLNHHLMAFSDYTGLKIQLFPAEMINSLIAAKVGKLLRLPPFDGSNFSDKWLHEHEIAAIRSFGLTWAQNHDASDIPVLIVSRGESDRHFASQRFRDLYKKHGDWNQTGSARRHIPNMDEIVEAISKETTACVVELEATDFPRQVSLFRRARIVIAQHGAGLNGLMWSRPGTFVLEILPYEKLGEPDTYFRNMARRLDLRHSYMIQNGEHEHVDARAIAHYVAQCKADAR